MSEVRSHRCNDKSFVGVVGLGKAGTGAQRAMWSDVPAGVRKAFRL